MVTKKIKHKNEAGTVVEVDLGAEAKNVSEDTTHRFVSDADKTNWNDANSKKHSHSNKTVLDKITQALLDNWSAAYAHVSDAVKHVTAAERANWNDANSKKHSHSNKGVLDTITQAMLDKLAGITAGANNYVHPTTAGNKHIPAGGTSGQFLKWSADGTAVWGPDNNTTYADMQGATSGAAGTHGLVPAPAAGEQAKYLRADGTWQAPPNMTYGVATQSTNGLMAAADKTKLDGVAVNANNYVHPSAHPASMIIQDATHRFTTDVEKTKLNELDENALKLMYISKDEAQYDEISGYIAKSERVNNLINIGDTSEDISGLVIKSDSSKDIFGTPQSDLVLADNGKMYIREVTGQNVPRTFNLVEVAREAERTSSIWRSIKDGDDLNDLKAPGIYYYNAPMVGENALFNAPYNGGVPAGPAIFFVSRIRSGSLNIPDYNASYSTDICQTMFDVYAHSYDTQDPIFGFGISVREYHTSSGTWTSWMNKSIQTY